MLSFQRCLAKSTVAGDEGYWLTRAGRKPDAVRRLARHRITISGRDGRAHQLEIVLKRSTPFRSRGSACAAAPADRNRRTVGNRSGQGVLHRRGDAADPAPWRQQNAAT
jgi:hypothetical protein